MTEEEKDKLRLAKATVTEELYSVDLDGYHLDEADNRLRIYADSVISNPDGHNLYEQLAVKRFFGLIDKYGLSVSEMRKFFTMFEMLYFPGKTGQQRYELTPVQAFQFASIYGFWNNGKRVTQEACLDVPRKYSKTTSSAAPIIYDLLYGESNAECYTGANSNDQAKKCFDVIRGCMRRLDPKAKRYTVNEQTIKSRRKDRTAFAQCLTANARTKDGLNASTVVMDEFSQARDSDLLYVLTTSMGVRVNPLTIIITTASDVFDGPFYSMLQGYKDLLLGEFEDDSVFAFICEPDVDDEEDSEDTWRKVQPHMDVTVSMDFYRKEYRNAIRNGSDAMLAFRTKLLNVYSENETRSWISSTLAKKISIPISIENIQGRPSAMVSIDLSESGDFSAVSFGIYTREKRTFYFHTAYFFPRGALIGHANEKLYRVWEDKGYLKILEGDVIDYRAIVEYVIGLNKYIEILGIGYDPWKSLEVVNMLDAAGAGNVLHGVSQTYGNFTAPVESFEHGAKTGHIFINDNPINSYCFGNAILDADKLENCKPIKRSENQKIDGVITMLMCMRQFIDYER